MTDRRRLAADQVEGALADLAWALEVPRASDGFAAAVTERIRPLPAPDSVREPWWRRLAPAPVGRPVRRSLLIAVALLLVIAAVATAVGLGVPGIRILFGPAPSATPSTPAASPTGIDRPLGSSLGLGAALPFDEAARLAELEPLLPADLETPAQAYVQNQRLTLVWPSSTTLGSTTAAGIGLLVTEFNGRVDTGWYEKQVIQGRTTVEEVRVDGALGYWVSGEPHGLIYRDARGVGMEETRRVVGDVLLWSRDGVTYRLETGLGKAAALELAESMR